MGKNTYFDDPLVHYGVLGMKWGVRKDRAAGGVPRKTQRLARKDAKEYTKAKMFYGEGAGTRRKLIKAKVEARSKRDPAYKRLFEEAVEKTNMAERAGQARSERARKNAKNKVRRGFKQVGHAIRGNTRYAGVLATAAVAAGSYYYRNGGKENVDRWGRIAFYKAMNSPAGGWAKNWLKQHGFG